MTVRAYGWIPDLPDYRDYLYAAPPELVRLLPQSVDLRRKCPPVYDQGQLGSCTANAIAGSVEFDMIKERQKRVFVPSRLFLYYNERVMEGTVNSDSGAQVRDGIKRRIFRRLPRTNMAIRYRAVRGETATERLPESDEVSSRSIPKASSGPKPNERMLSIRIPVRLRFPSIPKLREPSSCPQRTRPNAVTQRTPERRSRRHGRWIRRLQPLVSLEELLGVRLGHEGLLHPSIRVSTRSQPIKRLLDDQSRKLNQIA